MIIMDLISCLLINVFLLIQENYLEQVLMEKFLWVLTRLKKMLLLSKMLINSVICSSKISHKEK